jgi:HK97 family phage major capsid protein
MSDKAHSGNVVIPEDKANTLFRLIDEMEEQIDLNKQDREKVATDMRTALTKHDETRAEERATLLARLEATDQALAKNTQELLEMKARAEVLEKERSRGDQLYRDEDIPGIVLGLKVTGTQRRYLREFGMCVQDTYLMWSGRKPKWDVLTRDQMATDVTKGGHAVPRPIWDGVISLTPQMGFAPRYCWNTPMDSDTLDINTSTLFPDVAWPGEGVAPSDSSVLLSDPRPRLQAKELTSTNSHTMRFLETSLPSVLEFIGARHLQAHVLEIDRQVLAASANPFTGVLFAEGVGEYQLGTGSVSYHQFDHKSLVQTIMKADEQLFMDSGEETSNLRWAAHPSFYHNARQLEDADRRPIFVDMPATLPSTLIGYPYSRSIKMPKQTTTTTAGKAFAAFGDWRYCVVGDLMTTQVAFSEHEEFSKARVKMRVLAMVGTLVVLPQAFARIKTSGS